MRTPRMGAAVGDPATTESPRRAQRTILRAEPPPPPQARARTRLELALGSSPALEHSARVRRASAHGPDCEDAREAWPDAALRAARVAQSAGEAHRGSLACCL
jgi:hypothetical protein